MNDWWAWDDWFNLGDMEFWVDAAVMKSDFFFRLSHFVSSYFVWVHIPGVEFSGHRKVLEILSG